MITLSCLDGMSTGVESLAQPATFDYPLSWPQIEYAQDGLSVQTLLRISTFFLCICALVNDRVGDAE